MKWDNEKDNLKRKIKSGMSYAEIGRLYGCSGNNIKRVAKRFGIELNQRRKTNDKETFNKGTGKKYFCLVCGKQLVGNHQYCSNECQHKYEYDQWVKDYQADNRIAVNTKWGKIPSTLRRYIFEKYDYKCCKCGWSEINQYTNTLPLEIDHIDGDSNNNSEDNLQLVCPNCHSLTPTYKGANRGNGRTITWRLK